MTFLAADLNSAGPLISLLTTVGKFISLTASFATVGLLLAMAFFLIDDAGKLSKSAQALRNFVAITSLVWVLGQGLNILTTLANILGTSLTGALDGNSLRSFVSQIDLGKYMFTQLCLALIVCLLVTRVRTVAATNALLLLYASHNGYSLICISMSLKYSNYTITSSYTLTLSNKVPTPKQCPLTLHFSTNRL